MSTAPQNLRLDVRLDESRKRLIEQAADLLGQTVSAFTVSTLVREAEAVVARFGTLRLTDRDRDAFLSAIDKPPKPSDRLAKAAREHARKVKP
jgi:uncharacterized protein (DUF1778 family)